MPELVACSFYQFDLGSALGPYTADSLQYVSTQPAPIVTPTCIRNLYMPTDTGCIDTVYVHSDPNSLLSFAEEFRGLVTDILLLIMHVHGAC